MDECKPLVFGVVVDVFRGAGQHDLLKVSVPPLPPPHGEQPAEVKGPGEHVFIPFVKEIVPVVDLARGVAGGVLRTSTRPTLNLLLFLLLRILRASVSALTLDLSRAPISVE